VLGIEEVEAVGVRVARVGPGDGVFGNGDDVGAFAGAVTPVIDRRYSLNKVPEALPYLGEGHARGKVVIAVRELPGHELCNGGLTVRTAVHDQIQEVLMRWPQDLANPLLGLAFAILAGTALAVASAEATRVYQHPRLDVQFSAPDGWRQQPRYEDELIHEVIDPSTGIHVVLWYAATQQGAADYLCKIADMKGLVPGGCTPQTRHIGGLEARLISVSADIGGEAVHTMLAALQCGNDPIHADHDALYVVQIWCPTEDVADLGGCMKMVLDSVRIRTHVVFHGRELPLYPRLLERHPAVPSPFTADDGQVCVVARTRDGNHTVVAVTVENGVPAAYDRDLWGKGRQLDVDATDFPTLARTGLHDEQELDRATITGIPVGDLTIAARPGQLSRQGFIGANEQLLEVVQRDNRLVANLDLTHHQLARPLFHLFNLSQRGTEVYARGDAPHAYLTEMFYAGRMLSVAGEGGKGWQEPLFGDEVLGYYALDVAREPDTNELAYLERTYGRLAASELARLIEALFSIHTGEGCPSTSGATASTRAERCGGRIRWRWPWCSG
jgi:hypothetical protein